MRNNQNKIPSKLFKLKEWLTVPDAARHLSIMFGEEVKEADVFHLALDGHLKLSVNFVNHAYARRGDKFLPFDEWEERLKKKLSWQNAKTHAVHNNDGVIAIYFSGLDMAFYIKNDYLIKDSRSLHIGHDENLKSILLNKLPLEEQTELLDSMIKEATTDHKKQSEKFKGKVPPSTDSFRGKVLNIKGVWDLPMLGTESIDIEHEYQMLTNGPEITLTGLDGAFVEGEDGVICQLQESFDKEYIEYQNSDENKQKSLDFYRKALEKRVSKKEIDEKEAKKLLKQRKENLGKKRSYEDNFYPAGGLPDDSVLVVRTLALIDLQDRLSQTNSNKNTSLDPRSERTYLNIIGALLEVVTGTFKDETFSSETQLRDFIAEKFDDLRGVRPRTTADIFATAKKALNEDLD